MALFVQLPDSLIRGALKSGDLSVSCGTWGDLLTVDIESHFVPMLVQVFVVSEDVWSVILFE